MVDHSSSSSLFPERSAAVAEQEIFCSFHIPPDFQPPFFSNPFPLLPNNSPLSPQESLRYQEKPTNQTNYPIPMITIDNVPFVQLSASNLPRSAASLVPGSVPSINGISLRDLSRQEQPSGLLNCLFQNPNFWANRPPRSVYKLNVAVLQIEHEGFIFLCLGAVIRDHVGFVHQAVTMIGEDYQTPNEAEKYIYRLGIALSVARRYRRLIAETEREWLVEEYQDFCHPHLFDYFEARHVSIDDNRLANEFAENAVLYDNMEWTRQQIVEVFGSLRLPY